MKLKFTSGDSMLTEQQYLDDLLSLSSNSPPSLPRTWELSLFDMFGVFALARRSSDVLSGLTAGALSNISVSSRSTADRLSAPGSSVLTAFWCAPDGEARDEKKPLNFALTRPPSETLVSP